MRRFLFGSFILLIAAEAAAEETAKVRQSNDEAVAEIEAAILRALQGNMGESFVELRQKMQTLPADARRSLAVSIRPGVYQWRFHGVFPAETLQPAGLEYIVSSEIKNYESLLVVEGEEFQRVQRFGRAFDVVRKRLPETDVSVQLCWSEDGQVHSADLWEIYASAELAQVKDFIAALGRTPDGLGAINLAADTAALPKTETAAQVVITLEMPRKN